MSSLEKYGKKFCPFPVWKSLEKKFFGVKENNFQT